MDKAALDRHITGNWGEDSVDAAWEQAIEEIDGLSVTLGLEPHEIVAVFQIGLDAYQKAEEVIQKRALVRMREVQEDKHE